MGSHPISTSIPTHLEVPEEIVESELICQQRTGAQRQPTVGQMERER